MAITTTASTLALHVIHTALQYIAVMAISCRLASLNARVFHVTTN